MACGSRMRSIFEPFMITMVPVRRVKCRCRVRHFVQQRSGAVLIDRIHVTLSKQSGPLYGIQDPI